MQYGNLIRRGSRDLSIRLKKLDIEALGLQLSPNVLSPTLHLVIDDKKGDQGSIMWFLTA